MDVRAAVAKNSAVRIVARPHRREAVTGIEHVIPTFQADPAIDRELQQLDSVGRFLSEVGVNLLFVAAMRVKRNPSQTVDFVGDETKRRPVVGIGSQSVGFNNPLGAEPASAMTGGSFSLTMPAEAPAVAGQALVFNTSGVGSFASITPRICRRHRRPAGVDGGPAASTAGPCFKTSRYRDCNGNFRY